MSAFTEDLLTLNDIIEDSFMMYGSMECVLNAHQNFD